LTAHRGEVEIPLGRRRRRAVLARLALSANTPVTVPHLLDLLWPGEDERSALNSLHSYVSRLRSALGDTTVDGASAGAVLDLTAGGYRLRLGQSQLDLAEFRELVGGAAVLAAARPEVALARLEAALGLWRGNALADIPELCDSPLVAAVDEERVAAAVDHADVAIFLGRAERCLSTLRELADLRPLHEPVHSRLIAALAAAGRQAEALENYERIRRRLATELGVDPSPELRDAHGRVLRQEVYAAPGERVERPVPAQLPPEVPAFTGRDRELRQLDQLLSDGAQVVAISGTAGVGKTALVLHWAHRVAGRFPDGRLYVNLRGFAPAGPAARFEEVVRGFLDAFGVSPEQLPAEPDAQVALYRSMLDGKRVLLVLDNARDADQVRSLLPGSPGCLALVTSRNTLTGLVVTNMAHPIDLGLLDRPAARDLLVRRIGAGRVAAAPGAVREIVAACAGLPLALAIVAARAATNPAVSLDGLAGELSDKQESLDALDGGDPETDIRSVFSWSYRTLSAPAARLFRLIGLHPGPDIGTAAAASLAGVPPARVKILLAELTRAHLLTEGRLGRYACHDLLRSFATERGYAEDSAVEWRGALVRLLDHYLHTGYRAARLHEPGRDPIAVPPPVDDVVLETPDDHAAALGWFGTERTALPALVEQAAESGLHRQAWQLAWTMSTVLDHEGRWHELAAVQATALRAAVEAGDRLGQAHAHRASGLADACLTRYTDATGHYQRALSLLRGLGDEVGQANVRTNLAWVARLRGDTAEALEQARHALAGYGRAGHLTGQANTLNAIGWYQALLGQHADALASCQAALDLLRQLGDRSGEAATWDSLGYAHHQLGEYSQAAECYVRSVALYRDLVDRRCEADVLVHLADTQDKLGEGAAALASRRAALEILDRLDAPDADQLRKLVDGG
jgi:DNA-binding SARP family transcriptional activator